MEAEIEHIYREVIEIYGKCQQFRVKLEAEWLPRELNEDADVLSKEVDKEDYGLNQKVFSAVDKLWGPHTNDCFASRLSRQTNRSILRSANPDCVAVGAFSLSWAGENCWLFPRLD